MRYVYSVHICNSSSSGLWGNGSASFPPSAKQVECKLKRRGTVLAEVGTHDCSRCLSSAEHRVRMTLICKVRGFPLFTNYKTNIFNDPPPWHPDVCSRDCFETIETRVAEASLESLRLCAAVSTTNATASIVIVDLGQHCDLRAERKCDTR